MRKPKRVPRICTCGHREVEHTAYVPLPLTHADIDQIIEGLDHFCIGPQYDKELYAIWQPYIDKLTALKAHVHRACDACACAAFAEKEPA